MNFLKRWADLLILLPVAFLVFLSSGKLINFFDPTAATLSVENLSILSFNLLTLFTIFGSSYFIWALYFKDLFKEGWEKGVNRGVALALNAFLWAVNLFATAYVLLRNL